MQSSKMNTITHCKIQCGNEFRRFLLPSNKFSDLDSQIRATFGFGPEKNLVIKYTDEEGDNVTISSDEELEFAIGLFAGGLLRLTICGPKFGRHGHCAQKAEGCGPNRWESRGAMWKARWEAKLQANPQLLQDKVSRMEAKEAKMKERLQWLENKASQDFNPSLPHRIAHFQVKIAGIQSRIAHLRSLSGGVATPLNNPVVAPVPVATPQEKPSWKEAAQAKKAEMKSLREQVRNGTKTRAEVSERIFILKDELIAIRQQHRGSKGCQGRKWRKERPQM
jgi:hypothetical protein